MPPTAMAVRMKLKPMNWTCRSEGMPPRVVYTVYPLANPMIERNTAHRENQSSPARTRAPENTLN